MSWRRAAQLARDRAVECRDEADGIGVDEGRMQAFRSYLQRFSDTKAMVVWLKRRQAQHLEEFAGLCDARPDTDVTVLERPRRK